MITGATAASTVGTYPITVSGASNANYSISYINGTLTVTPADLTISALSTNKVYGAPVPVLTAIYSGFVNGDTETNLDSPAQLTTQADAASAVGPYPITVSGATSTNYSITFQEGVLTIEKAALTGIVSSTQNPATPGQEVTFSFGLSAVAPGAGTPAGTVQFKIDGANAGSGLLANSVASFSTSGLSVGTHVVRAEYSGDGNFTGATNILAPDQMINTPPAAVADTIERYPSNSVKVTIAALLSNDSDADHDTLTFVSVSSDSTNGGTVTRKGNWIFYTPVTGFVGDDSFTYQITDGRGATNTGTVTVAIKLDNAPAMNLRITDLGNRQYHLRFDGVPYRSYSIQYTEGMQPPHWQPLTNAMANQTGMFECIVTNPEGTPRFYRSVYP